MQAFAVLHAPSEGCGTKFLNRFAMLVFTFDHVFIADSNHRGARGGEGEISETRKIVVEKNYFSVCIN